MIIEDCGLVGLEADLTYLDEVMEELGFVRGQWDYYRATYDLKLKAGSEDYYLRINTRIKSGKLEKPDAILAIEAVYMGRVSFPHGLDYETPIPQKCLHTANERLHQLKEALSA